MAKKLWILAVVFVMLLALLAAKHMGRRQPHGDIAEQLEIRHSLGEQFVLSNVVRLELYSAVRPDKKLVLAFLDRRWVIASHHNTPCNQEAVEKFLTMLKSLSGQSRPSTQESLRDFCVEEEPHASSLRRDDLVEKYLENLLTRLKNRGEYLFSIDPSFHKDLNQKCIPEPLRKMLQIKGYLLSAQIEVDMAANGGWSIQDRENQWQWNVAKDSHGIHIYRVDPLAIYLQSKLSQTTLSLLQGYDSRDYPRGMAHFILGKLDTAGDPLASYLQKSLADISRFANADVEKAIRIYVRHSVPPENLQRSIVFLFNLLLKEALVSDLNRIFSSELLYHKTRFPTDPGEEIQQIIAQNPQGNSLITLNRLLLERAYPREIAKSGRPIHVEVYSEQDASQPAYHLLVGKKVIYREDMAVPGTSKVASFVRSQRVIETVYEVGQDLRGAMMIYNEEDLLKGVPVTPWLGKVIELQSGEKHKIQRIAIVYPDKEIIFTKLKKQTDEKLPSEYKWQVEKGPKWKMKSEAIDRLLSQINSFEAKNLVANGYLFAMDLSHQDQLAKSQISEELQTVFKNNGHALGEHTQVTSQNTGWSIKSDDREYWVSKTPQSLEIYDTEVRRRWGLCPPQFVLEIATDVATYEVLSGLPEPGRDAYVFCKGRPGVVYQVWYGKFSEIFQKGAEFFELPSPRIEKSQIAEIVIDDAEGRFVLKAEVSNGKIGWHCPNSSHVLRHNRLEQMLAAFDQLSLEDYADIEFADMFPGQIKVTTRDGSSYDIKIGKRSPLLKGNYALVEKIKLLGVLDETNVKQILPSRQELLEVAK